MKPQQIAQYQKRGRGFLITRNSATLADTDYEPIAKEIVDALNKRHAYAGLVATLRATIVAMEDKTPKTCPLDGSGRLLNPLQAEIKAARDLLSTLGELGAL